MTTINLFRNTFDPAPLRTLALGEALAAIRTGAYRREIERLLRVRAGGEVAAYRRAKEQLPAFTFAGTFQPTRCIANLVQHSGIVHGDLDHLPDVDATRQQLSQDPSVLYCFRSPSREGLKLGVRIDPVADDAAYKHAWAVVAADHPDRYGVTWDPTGKDVSRLCYVSWDPDCYDNPEAHAYPVPPAMVTPEPPRRHLQTATPQSQISGDRRTRYTQQAIDRAVRMIQEAPQGQQHHARLRAARLLGGYVAGGFLSEEEARATLQTPTEVQADNVRAAMKTIADGLAYGQAVPITYDDLEADWAQWKASHPLPIHGTSTPSIFARPPTQEASPWHF